MIRRVLFVIGSAAIGGAEELMCLLVRGLTRAGHVCVLICPASGPMAARYREAGAEVSLVPHQLLHPAAIWRIARLIRQHRIDVVHTCLYASDVAGLFAARLAGAPRIISHVVGCNFVVSRERGWRRARKRLLSWAHRGIYALADCVIAVSDSVKADLATRPGLRVPPSKITVIRHGWDAPAASHGWTDEAGGPEIILDDGPAIVAVANLFPLKGHRYLLEAVELLVGRWPRLRCVLVGDGPERSALEQHARRLGLEERVRFAGWIDEPAKRRVIERSRCVVLPSLSEGLPVCVLEAMAFSKPVVASRIGGIPEIVEDGRTGMLVPPADSRALAEAIHALLSDAALAERMGQAGRQRLQQHFSAGQTIERMEELYAG